jgi:hypothetical protein
VWAVGVGRGGVTCGGDVVVLVCHDVTCRSYLWGMLAAWVKGRLSPHQEKIKAYELAHETGVERAERFQISLLVHPSSNFIEIGN